MPRPILRMDEVFDAEPAQLLLRISVHGRICRIAVLESSSEIGNVNADSGIFINALVACLALSQDLIAPVVLDEVSGHPRIEIQDPQFGLARSMRIAKMGRHHT